VSLLVAFKQARPNSWAFFVGKPVKRVMVLPNGDVELWREARGVILVRQS
jgi:hypothetical protein